MKMRFCKRLICWLFLTLIILVGVNPLRAADATNRILILVSLDGYRWDYLEKFKASTPNLNRLAAEGVHARRLISAFPSLTFPNHYTIVTGLWPAHHGIVNNHIYDPDLKEDFSMGGETSFESHWWGGEPIWVTAVKQGRVADCIFWPGSDVEIEGVRPTKWERFDKRATPDECVDLGLDRLAQTNQRPDFLTLYFHEVDTESHHNGVESKQVAEAAAELDEAMGRLVNGLHRLKLDDAANIIIVSDHGMTDLSTNRVIILSDLVDSKTVHVDATGAIAGLRPLDGNVDALYKKLKSERHHYKVYRWQDMPKRYHYTGNPRIPPVVMVADEGWYISRRPLDPHRSFEKATHGFDPKLKSMGATFIAWGPAFRHGVTIAPTENVNIYNLLCATLGLTPAPNDGDNTLVKKVLANPASK